MELGDHEILGFLTFSILRSFVSIIMFCKAQN